MNRFLDPTQSALGRPIDPRYPTNLAVLILVPVAALIGVWIGDAGIAAGAIVGAGTFFFSWALARELAPDHPLSAFGAAGLSMFGLAIFPQPSIAVALGLLTLARLVNRSVGPPARWLDTGAVLAITGFAAWSTHSAGPVLVAAVGFALDRRLQPRGPTRHGPIALVAAIAGLIGVALSAAGRHPAGAASGTLEGVVVLATLLFSIGIVRTRRVTSGADRDGSPLSPVRVRAAMALAPLFVVSSWLPGGPTLEELGIVVTTMVALVLPLLLPRRRTATSG